MFVNVVQRQSDLQSSLLEPQSLLLYAGLAIIVLGVGLTLSSHPALQRLFHARFTDKFSFEFTIPVLVFLIGTAMAFAWLVSDIKGISDLQKTISDLQKTISDLQKQIAIRDDRIIQLENGQVVNLALILIPPEGMSLEHPENLMCRYKLGSNKAGEEPKVEVSGNSFSVTLHDIPLRDAISSLVLVDKKKNNAEVAHVKEMFLPLQQQFNLQRSPH